MGVDLRMAEDELLENARMKMTMSECKHENLQTVMSNAWIEGHKLYSVRCSDCGAATELCFTVGEALTRFKLGIFGCEEKEST